MVRGWSQGSNKDHRLRLPQLTPRGKSAPTGHVGMNSARGPRDKHDDVRDASPLKHLKERQRESDRLEALITHRGGRAPGTSEDSPVVKKYSKFLSRKGLQSMASEDLTSENLALRKQLDNLSTEAKEKEAEHKHLKKILEEIQSRKDEFERSKLHQKEPKTEKLDSLKQRITDAQSGAEDASRYLSTLDHIKARTKKALIMSESGIRQIRSELESTSSELEDARVILQQSTQKKDETVCALEKLKRQVSKDRVTRQQKLQEIREEAKKHNVMTLGVEAKHKYLREQEESGATTPKEMLREQHDPLRQMRLKKESKEKKKLQKQLHNSVMKQFLVSAEADANKDKQQLILEKRERQSQLLRTITGHDLLDAEGIVNKFFNRKDISTHMSDETAAKELKSQQLQDELVALEDEYAIIRFESDTPNLSERVKKEMEDEFKRAQHKLATAKMHDAHHVDSLLAHIRGGIRSLYDRVQIPDLGTTDQEDLPGRYEESSEINELRKEEGFVEEIALLKRCEGKLSRMLLTAELHHGTGEENAGEDGSTGGVPLSVQIQQMEAEFRPDSPSEDSQEFVPVPPPKQRGAPNPRGRKKARRGRRMTRSVRMEGDVVEKEPSNAHVSMKSIKDLPVGPVDTWRYNVRVVPDSHEGAEYHSDDQDYKGAEWSSTEDEIASDDDVVLGRRELKKMSKGLVAKITGKRHTVRRKRRLARRKKRWEENRENGGGIDSMFSSTASGAKEV